MIHSAIALLALLAMPAMAQQPVLPLPKAGACPLGCNSTATTSAYVAANPHDSSGLRLG